MLPTRFYKNNEETADRFSTKEGLMVFAFIMVFAVITGLLTFL